MRKNVKEQDRFLEGVMACAQYMLFQRRDPQYAGELLREHGFTQDEALKESKKTGCRVREMNRLIRDELK